jgi:hypothetical protein
MAGIDRGADNTSLRYPSVRCSTPQRDHLGNMSVALRTGIQLSFTFAPKPRPHRSLEKRDLLHLPGRGRRLADQS